MTFISFAYHLIKLFYHVSYFFIPGLSDDHEIKNHLFLMKSLYMMLLHLILTFLPFLNLQPGVFFLFCFFSFSFFHNVSFFVQLSFFLLLLKFEAITNILISKNDTVILFFYQLDYFSGRTFVSLYTIFLKIVFE